MCAWAVCYSGSNNAHFNFPPIMTDGRNYATWQPEAVINERIQRQENIHTNWHYRLYLQQHGMKIMNYNTMESCYELGLPYHVQSDKTPSDNVPVPHRYRNVYDTSKPGFGYCNSDLKNPYLSREQLNARMVAPSISSNVVSMS